MARFGRVALIGRSNVGKSTLLNAAMEEPLAIVSPVPQTTRTSLLGIVHRGDDQIAFVDTPGIHQPKTELGRRMNAAALEAIRQCDVGIYVTDVSASVSGPSRGRATSPAPSLTDIELVRSLPERLPLMLVVNKVDLLKSKQLLLPLLEAWSKVAAFAAMVPVSCLVQADVARVLDALVVLLPEAPPAYPRDELTDRPTRYFIAEYVREQVLLQTRREVPHAVAVSVDEYREAETLVSISATLHVEKDGQRRILIGRGGAAIVNIGRLARQRIERLVGKKVHLELFVKTNPRWKSIPRQLAELGYEGDVTNVTTKLNEIKS